MKTVLFLIPTLGGGGAEKVLVNLVNALDRHKYSIEIKTLFSNSTNKCFIKSHNKYSSCFGKQLRGNRILFKLFSPRILYRLLIGKRYDIVVSYLEGPTERIVAGCPYEDTKLINWVHVEQHKLSVATASYRSAKEANKCLDMYSATVCVSQTVKDDYLQLFTLSHPIEVCYNTNDIDAIIRGAREPIDAALWPEGINLVSVGRITDVKGFDRLINAHKRLLDDGLAHNLVILGDGELKNGLMKQAESLGVSDTVYFLGFQSNPYKYVSRADLFVCSSRREGFSTAVTEALTLGVPVVSTLVSGARELLGTDDEYGIVTDNSEEGVYQGMRRMLSDPSLLQHYRRQAAIRAKKFSTENTVSAVEQLFDSL